MYANGWGVNRDTSEARSLYEQAARFGNERAVTALKLLARKPLAETA
jgi:TPR repeat protein